MTLSPACRIESMPALICVKDMAQTLVLGEQTGRSWSLCGLEAAIWDLLVLDYSFEKVVGVLSALLGVGAAEAEGVLLVTLRRWAEQGMVAICQEDGQCPTC